MQKSPYPSVADQVPHCQYGAMRQLTNAANRRQFRQSGLSIWNGPTGAPRLRCRFLRIASTDSEVLVPARERGPPDQP